MVSEGSNAQLLQEPFRLHRTSPTVLCKYTSPVIALVEVIMSGVCVQAGLCAERGHIIKLRVVFQSTVKAEHQVEWCMDSNRGMPGHLRVSCF